MDRAVAGFHLHKPYNDFAITWSNSSFATVTPHNMSDIPPLATYSMPDASDHTNGTVDADAPFIALAHALELYVDDLVWQPTFHQFTDLPIELRCKVYTQHFLDDSQSLTTIEWPWLHWPGVFTRRQLQSRSSVPFLPALCLTSKDCLTEVLPFLISSLTLECQDSDTAMYFLENAAHLQTLEIDIAKGIRRLRILDMNGMRTVGSVFVEDVPNIDINMKIMVMNNRAASVCLNSFKGLREMRISFHAPIEYRLEHAPPTPIGITALFIYQYLTAFNPQSILDLKNLQKVDIYGSSGKENMCASNPARAVATFRDDVVANLRPLSFLARKLKDGFKAKRQEVKIRVCLRWGNKESEVTVVH